MEIIQKDCSLISSEDGPLNVRKAKFEFSHVCQNVRLMKHMLSLRCSIYDTYLSILITCEDVFKDRGHFSRHWTDLQVISETHKKFTGSYSVYRNDVLIPHHSGVFDVGNTHYSQHFQSGGFDNCHATLKLRVEVEFNAGIEFFSTVCERFLYNVEMSDIIIKIDKTEIPAHYSILTANSAVFQELFLNQSILTISDTDVYTFKLMLSFLYRQKLEKLEVNILIKLIMQLVTTKFKV